MKQTSNYNIISTIKQTSQDYLLEGVSNAKSAFSNSYALSTPRLIDRAGGLTARKVLEIDKWNSFGKYHWTTIGKCHWKSTMTSEVSISGVQYFAPLPLAS